MDIDRELTLFPTSRTVSILYKRQKRETPGTGDRSIGFTRGEYKYVFTTLSSTNRATILCMHSGG